MCNYRLISLKRDYLDELYQWQKEEKNPENYTCRPVINVGNKDEFISRVNQKKEEQENKSFLLVGSTNKELIGKISLFDYNIRNCSAEFGYYLPQHNRNKGIGSILIKLFLDKIFYHNTTNDIYKIYATTSSNNIASIKLLEKFNFKLDGRLRDHYWIKEKKYDQLVYSLLKKEWSD